MFNAGMLNLDASNVAGVGTSGSGLLLADGSVAATGGTVISGTVNGVVIQGENRFGTNPAAGRHLLLDGSTVQGQTGSAIVMGPRDPVQNTADVTLRNGARVVGGNGVAFEAGGATDLTVQAENSTVVGGATVSGGAHIGLDLGSGAAMTGDLSAADGRIDAVVSGGRLLGATRGNVGMTLTDGSWQMTADSSLASLALDGGSLTLGDGSRWQTLRVDGGLTGSAGDVVFHTQMNAGGALAAQNTDRLLIAGDVTTTGRTRILVVPTGDGALTDANRNGAVDANEGISLIQVAGSSRADAFVLAGTYVAAGPYQYTLHAFGPGATDASQSLLPSGTSWDYRLGNRYVSDCGDACPPVDPVPEPGLDPEPEPSPDPVDRVAIVPQLPSYMLAPMALQNYGNALNDGLHQRLGEIRDSTYGAQAGGEVFARAISSQLNYTRNLSFQRYGYDFDQQINALQVGAGIVAVDTDQGSIRAGWALDSGSTRVTPSAADGNSRAKYYANGGHAWVTYQHGSGLWVDGVLGVTRFHGDVSTDLRGDEVGKLHAQGWTMSVEVGKPLPLGGDWTVEPQFQFRVQQLNFRDFRDKDGLDIRLGNSVQATSRLGIQIGRTANPVFAPYGRLDLIHISNGNPTLQASSEAWNAGDTFQTGNTGNAYRVAAGLTSQLTDHVQLYGEGTWQHFVGSYGLKGWSANAGIRVTF